MNQTGGKIGSEGALAEIRRRAALRWKAVRSKDLLGRFFLGLAIAVTLWVAVLLLFPSSVLFFPYFAGALLLLLLIALACVWGRTIPPGKLDREIDRRLALPDLALTAGELDGTPPGPWHERQQNQAVAAISPVDFATAWPARWPRWATASLFPLAVMLAVLGYVYFVELEARGVLAADAGRRAERLAPIEELFKDWDREQVQDEELKKLMEEIRPIRERLVNASMDDTQRFADLNRVEEILAAEQAKVEARSLEPQAGQLADAFEKIEGMSALAAALRRKDFGKAEEQAREAGEKLAAAEAAPEGAREASGQLASAAQGFGKRGNQAMSESLSELSQGAREGSTRKMAGGMKGLQAGLAREKTRKREARRLSFQLSQISFCRECLADGNGRCLAMPCLSLLKKPGGKNAGSGTDPNRFGAETALDGERRAETAGGSESDGESEVTTVRTTEGQAEAARATGTVKFQEYERLSRQAIEDEAIPLAYRETIKRYFERIRPASEN